MEPHMLQISSSRRGAMNLRAMSRFQYVPQLRVTGSLLHCGTPYPYLIRPSPSDVRYLEAAAHKNEGTRLRRVRRGKEKVTFHCFQPFVISCCCAQPTFGKVSVRRHRLVNERNCGVTMKGLCTRISSPQYQRWLRPTSTLSPNRCCCWDDSWSHKNRLSVPSIVK